MAPLMEKNYLFIQQDHFRLLIELSQNQNLELNTRLRYADDAVDYAVDLESVELITESYINLGDVHIAREEDEEAIQAYQDAYDASDEDNYRDGMANALVRLGRAYINMYDDESAINYMSIEYALLHNCRFT